jgi:hypothetical protein
MLLGEFGLVIPFVAPVQCSLFDATSIHSPEQPSFLDPTTYPPTPPDKIPHDQRAPKDAEHLIYIRLCFIIYTNTKALRHLVPINFCFQTNRTDQLLGLMAHRGGMTSMLDTNRAMWSSSWAQWNYLMTELIHNIHNQLLQSQTMPPDPNCLLSLLRDPLTNQPPRLIAQDLNPCTSLSTYRRWVGICAYQRDVYEMFALHI